MGFGGHRDPDGRIEPRSVEWDRHPPGVARVAAGEHPGREPYVPDLAADRALHGDELRKETALGRRARVEGGHPPEGRFHRRDPARERREAQRPSDVVAVVDRPEPHRRGGGRPAGGAARRRRLVPRIEGAAAQRVVGRPPHRKLGSIGATHDDRAGIEQVAHHRRVIRGNEAGQRGEAVRGRLSGDVDVLLDGDRDAVQRARRRPAVDLAVLLLGGAQRVFGAVRDDRVDTPVVRGDASEHRLRYLDARCLARPDHRGQLDRAPAPQTTIHVPDSSTPAHPSPIRRIPCRRLRRSTRSACKGIARRWIGCVCQRATKRCDIRSTVTPRRCAAPLRTAPPSLAAHALRPAPGRARRHSTRRFRRRRPRA